MNDGGPSDASGRVILEVDAPFAVLRFNNPEERNALSAATLDRLDEIISALVPRSDISSIIFTGTGEQFASGANIRELRSLTVHTAGAFARRGQSLLQKIADAPQFTVAAINGYCMGGALDLALACKFRCASPGAVFAHPGARLGIITGWGGTQRLSRLVGTARALEMFLTARRITGEEAFAIGLVNRLGDPALACAIEAATEETKKKCRSS